MSFLEDFQANLESLPAMLHRTYATMRDLDKSVNALQHQNEQRCEKEISDIKRGFESGNVMSDASLVRYSDEALEEQKHCIRIADEKVALATQAYDLVDSQIQQLDQYLRTVDERRQEKERAAAAAGGGGANNINPGSNTRSGRGSGSKPGRKKAQVPTEPLSVNIDIPVDPNEPTYCFCNQVSFGEMVACDNPDCKIEWFHFGCVGLKEQPKGKWYCSNCVGLQKRRKGK